jgi:hypothetical protein
MTALPDVIIESQFLLNSELHTSSLEKICYLLFLFNFFDKLTEISDDLINIAKTLIYCQDTTLIGNGKVLHTETVGTAFIPLNYEKSKFLAIKDASYMKSTSGAVID